MTMKTTFASSLEKIFSDVEFTGTDYCSGSACPGEVFAFQFAGKPVENTIFPVELSGDFPGSLRWTEVVSVPSDVPCHIGDANYLRTTPGLYPDLLHPRPAGSVRWPANQWRSIWIAAEIPAGCVPGNYRIHVKMGENEADFTLRVLDFKPADFTLRHTEWFHTDCLATYYQVPVWSEAHWKIVENFVRNAVKHHVNVMYTPLWTPPLDTAVGSERPTVQLLKISRDAAGKYHFDFTRLVRWCRMAREAGMQYLELSHFFSQWGARYTPKIIVEVNGREEQLFGWAVAATNPEYTRFLQALVPELHRVLDTEGWKGQVLCHVSDEPSDGHLESYQAARDILKPLAGDWTMIDALSHYEYYEKGLIDNPIPSIGVIEDFAGRVPQLWTYYCCGPEIDTVNRFCAMPSARIRILGVQAYVYNLVGFLHWGFNFYYSQCSVDQSLNPFVVTDGGRAFPSGDAFLVYPGKDGMPWDSIRHEVLREGWQDWCLLKQYEAVHGREATLALLHKDLDYQISATKYPTDPAWLLSLRDRLG